MNMSNDFIAGAMRDAIQQAMLKEVLLITGKHLEREQGVGKFRFRLGSNPMLLRNDLAKLCHHMLMCCRGMGFGIRVDETVNEGAQVNLTVSSNPMMGQNLVERS